MTQETDLFRARAMVQEQELSALLTNSEGVKFTEVPKEEQAEMMDNLLFHDNFGSSGSGSSKGKFFRVPFTDALELVRTRKVFVRGGDCFVPQDEMVTLVTWLFKSTLNKALVYTSKILPNLDEDDRLLQVMKQTVSVQHTLKFVHANPNRCLCV